MAILGRRTNLLRFSPYEACSEAIELGQRIPRYESIILRSPSEICRYAKEVIKGRWSRGEERLAKSSNLHYPFLYARDIMGCRWPKIEQDISQEGSVAVAYAVEVIKDRWPECEDSLYPPPRSEFGENPWLEYLKFLQSKNYSEEERFRWLREDNFTDKIFEILNFVGMSFKMQEYVIQKRPDLISKIKKIRNKLKEKYMHELLLSGMDI